MIMVAALRSSNVRKSKETMKLMLTLFVGLFFGFFLGISVPTLTLTKMNLPSALFPSIDLTYIENKYSGISKQALFKTWYSLKQSKVPRQFYKFNRSGIWVPSNPQGAERLPPGIIESTSDFYLRRLWGQPYQDLTIQPRYLVTFTVGCDQKDNIDAAVKKFSGNFTILLFHYDGCVSEWDEFEWSKRAIHVSAPKQTKWWYAKRFLHPDIVASYDYIFVWDEDLGLENFDAEEYIRLVKKHGLEISQPALSPDSTMTWSMTRKRDDTEVHKDSEERPGWCTNPHLPPCAAFVEIMAPVFSQSAWRCVWHMIQNDLVHGWGLDFALRKCVVPAHEKIGVVDTQWIEHQNVPTLGNQGQSEAGRPPWQGVVTYNSSWFAIGYRSLVRTRCKLEWRMFQDRMATAERAYYLAMGLKPPKITVKYWD